MTLETIVAQASGFGRAGIAVLRISGPGVPAVLAAMIGRVPEPRRATLARFNDPVSGEIIDRGLALFFPAPASFTGEDYAEFQCHGGPAVVAAMLAALGAFPATRLAEAGEFSRRAFENGKFDLTEIEGLADLVEAETQAQRRQALRQAQGALHRRAESWRTTLIEASALIEAAIDFADEADVAERACTDILGMIGGLRAQLERELAAGAAGERLRDGLCIVIAGPPNAGKSTLLNVLARREAAIVSALPGTTRDAIEVHLELSGLPVTLIDTAGLRASDDPIEAIGMARTQEKAAAADLVLWLSEAAAPQAPPLFGATETWRVFTKLDLGNRDISGDALILSALTGENIALLLAKLTDFARNATAQGEGALITRARHRTALLRAIAALDHAEAAPLAPELLAEDLRVAIRALESLVGKVDVEMVLGEIFSRFCIGK